MIKYFKTTKPKDFKNSKKFWKFYPNYISFKSDKSGQQSINAIKQGSVLDNDPVSKGNITTVKVSFLARDQARANYFCTTFHYDHFGICP